MQQSNAPSKLVLAFASAGSKNTIPVASQIGIVPGAASLTDGFPPLTRTPLAAGGVPPSGLDMNGILYTHSAIVRWLNAGGGFAYDSAFASDANVGGYPKGAQLLRSDGAGYWLNLTDNNTTDPESAGAAAAGWVPGVTNGVATVAMASSNVTLTPLQYGKPVITLTGTITTNLNLIFPAIAASWTVINNTTGAFTITAKTASGTGVAVTGTTQIVGDGTNITKPTAATAAQIAPVSSSVSANALTASYSGGTLDFRSATLANGAPIAGVSVGSVAITVPSGATLGTVNAVASRLVLLVAYNAGTPVLCITNLAGGVQLDETNLISPTTISSGATSAGVIYSESAVSANSPYRVVGFVDSTQATAGTWATAPTQVQGAGGQALAAMASLGYGQTWQNVRTTPGRTIGTTYYNTTGKPIVVHVQAGNASASNIILTVAGIALTGPYMGAGASTGHSWIVPAGASYVLGGVDTLLGWFELR